ARSYRRNASSFPDLHGSPAILCFGDVFLAVASRGNDLFGGSSPPIGDCGFSGRCHCMLRLVLLFLAPVIARLLNVLRIVGTGFAASLWGAQAARGLHHATWAIVLFLLGTALLLGARNLLQWLASRSASPSY